MGNTREELGKLIEVDLTEAHREIDRLNARVQILLSNIWRISQTTPLAEEASEALEQRGKLLAEIGTERARVDELLRQRERNALDMDAVSARLKIAEEMRDTLRRKLGTVIEAYGAVHEFAVSRGLDTVDGDHPSKSDVDAAGDALAEIDELVDVG